MFSKFLQLPRNLQTEFIASLSPRERVELARWVDSAPQLGDTTGAEPAADMERWLYEPAEWCREFTDFNLTPYQERALETMIEHGRLALRGPHGLGKTHLDAAAIWWFSQTAERLARTWVIPTTASANRQLYKFLWPRVNQLYQMIKWEKWGGTKPRKGKDLLLYSLKGVHGESYAASAKFPEELEGAHASRVLYIFDEAKLLSDAVFDSAEGAFSTAGEDTGDEAYALANSTPGATSGPFYRFHKGGDKKWKHQHVTIDEALASGRVSAEWVKDRRDVWGENNFRYVNRVLGNFQADEVGSIIPHAWVELAIERWHTWFEDHEPPTLPLKAGVDVAREGEDQTIIGLGKGHVLWRFEEEAHTENIVDLGDRVIRLMGKGGHATVDADGMGVGTADQIRRRKVACFPFHGGKQAKGWTDRTGELEAVNRRAAAWWNIRELLDPANNPVICLPPDDDMLNDLVSVKEVYDAGGKIRIEKKEDTKKRIHRSPDKGDTVVYFFWREPKQNTGATKSNRSRLDDHWTGR